MMNKWMMGLLAGLVALTATADVTIDMGDASNLNTYGNSAVASNQTGYTESGFVGYNNNADSGFTVEAPTDFVSFTITYAAYSVYDEVETAGDFYVEVLDTDTLATDNIVTFDTTGSWDTWVSVTLDLSGEAGDYLSFAFADTDNNGGVNVDSITLNEAIPEPTTLSLIGLVGAGAIFIRRRLMS